MVPRWPERAFLRQGTVGGREEGEDLPGRIIRVGRRLNGCHAGGHAASGTRKRYRVFRSPAPGRGADLFMRAVRLGDELAGLPGTGKSAQILNAVSIDVVRAGAQRAGAWVQRDGSIRRACCAGRAGSAQVEQCQLIVSSRRQCQAMRRHRAGLRLGETSGVKPPDGSVSAGRRTVGTAEAGKPNPRP